MAYLIVTSGLWFSPHSPDLERFELEVAIRRELWWCEGRAAGFGFRMPVGEFLIQKQTEVAELTSHSLALRTKISGFIAVYAPGSLRGQYISSTEKIEKSWVI